MYDVLFPLKIGILASLTLYACEKYYITRNLGRYAPKFLAPAEGWWPSATDW